MRIHSDAAAAASASHLGALAFTVGQHVVFGAGQYSPATAKGRRLLAHELTHVVQQRRRGAGENGDAVVHRQTPGPPEELPLPTRCSIVFDGDKFGPKLKCEGVPGIGSTPPIPLDPRQIPPYVKEKIGGLVPTTPSSPTSPGGPLGPSGPAAPTEIPLSPDIVAKFCRDFPAICMGQPKPTLGPLVRFRWLRVPFRQDRPQPGESLAQSLAAGRSALDDAIETMKSDVLVTAVLIGHASSEGSAERNFDLSARRVGMVYQELSDAKLAWRVFEPAMSASDTAGCQPLGIGRWSCGEAQADPSKADPLDRNVTIVLYRRLVFEPSPWSLPAPGPWGGLGADLIGPF